jgi:lysophospholipase L1-like esterase
VLLAEFEANLRAIIEELRKHQARPILMTTNPTRWTAKLKELYGKPPYNPDAADGFDTPVLANYNAAVRRLGQELKIPVVDVHAAFTANKPDELLLDGMHPNDAGHALVADLLFPVITRELSR